jgi:hypothetical protein
MDTAEEEGAAGYIPGESTVRDFKARARYISKSGRANDGFWAEAQETPHSAYTYFFKKS